MTSQKLFVAAVFIFFFAAHSSFAQFDDSSFYPQNQLELGLDFEYIPTSIEWDENQETSSIGPLLLTLSSQLKVGDRFRFGIRAGYAFSSFDQIIFRELPFSIDLKSGSIGGLILGGDIGMTVTQFGDFELGAEGRFQYYLGMDKEWSIPGLSVDGTVSGKPTWMKITAGPRLTYTGYRNFLPYLSVCFHHLWGTFRAEQTIEELNGSEDKKFTSLGVIQISLGTFYEVTSRLKFKATTSMIPNTKSPDFGFSFGAVYSF